jgi:opacity protein-like surface antigen
MKSPFLIKTAAALFLASCLLAPCAVASESEGEGQSGQYYEPYGRNSQTSGFYLRFGYLQDSLIEQFAYKWMASLGYDFGISRNFSIGIELQPAYRNIEGLGLKMYPVRGWINAKLGFELPFLRFLSLYVGGGAGGQAVYSTLNIQGETDSDFQANFGYLGLGGIRFRLGSITFVAEYQFSKISVPEVDPDSWQQHVLFGIQF